MCGTALHAVVQLSELQDKAQRGRDSGPPAGRSFFRFRHPAIAVAPHLGDPSDLQGQQGGTLLYSAPGEGA